MKSLYLLLVLCYYIAHVHLQSKFCVIQFVNPTLVQEQLATCIAFQTALIPTFFPGVNFFQYLLYVQTSTPTTTIT